MRGISGNEGGQKSTATRPAGTKGADVEDFANFATSAAATAVVHYPKFAMLIGSEQPAVVPVEQEKIGWPYIALAANFGARA